jgi:hypothetical protein
MLAPNLRWVRQVATPAKDAVATRGNYRLIFLRQSSGDAAWDFSLTLVALTLFKRTREKRQTDVSWAESACRADQPGSTGA